MKLLIRTWSVQFLVCIGCVSSTFAGVVEFLVSGTNATVDGIFPVADSSGVLLPIGTTLKVGTFVDGSFTLLTDQEIRDGFFSDTLTSNFVSLLDRTINGSADGGNITGAPGFYEFADVTGNQTQDSTANSLIGFPVFTWIMIDGGIEAIIFRHTFPIGDTASVGGDIIVASLVNTASFGQLVLGNFGQFTLSTALGNLASISAEAIPEPSTYLLMALGGVALLFYTRRSR